MSPRHALGSDAVVYVAGHRGMVGGAVTRELQARGVPTLGRSSSEVDLREAAAVDALFSEIEPTHVVLAAARVGGILANSRYPVEFLTENLLIQINVLEAARRAGVQRLLFLGSSCIYPKFAEQPIREDSLLTGPLEPTNDAYAIAKIAGVMHVQAVRRQYGLPWVSAMPTNLYGPGDNFSLENSHVLPAMLRKMHDAKHSGAAEVVLWGTGSPRREFLHVEDLADAVLFLLEHYDDDPPINVGVGEDVSIKELAHAAAEAVGYRGRLQWDTSKPDGTPRKLLDVSRLHALGWRARTPLRAGIAATYDWFQSHVLSGARL